MNLVRLKEMIHHIHDCYRIYGDETDLHLLRHLQEMFDTAMTSVLREQEELRLAEARKRLSARPNRRREAVKVITYSPELLDTLFA